MSREINIRIWSNLIDRWSLYILDCGEYGFTGLERKFFNRSNGEEIFYFRDSFERGRSGLLVLEQELIRKFRDRSTNCFLSRPTQFLVALRHEIRETGNRRIFNQRTAV